MRYSNIPYGNAPKVLGQIDLNPTEHMLYLYLPVKMAGSPYWMLETPENLHFIDEMMWAILDDAEEHIGDLADYYIYVTAKTMHVEAGAPGNRPGWHADGYGSGGDLNYIWYDMNPTQFAVMPFEDIPDDDYASMATLDWQIHEHTYEDGHDECLVTYPCQTLLRLDESVVHRVNPNPSAGIRTFIKVSISRHKYNLKGNSHNYLFDYNWEMHDRLDVRNTDNKDFVR